MRTSYLSSICRPLIQLRHIAEARKALNEALGKDGWTNDHAPYADRAIEFAARIIELRLRDAEGRGPDARAWGEDIIRIARQLHAECLRISRRSISRRWAIGSWLRFRPSRSAGTCSYKASRPGTPGPRPASPVVKPRRTWQRLGNRG